MPDYISTFVMDALRGAGKNITAYTNKAIVKGAKSAPGNAMRKTKELKEKIAEKRRGRAGGASNNDPVIEPKDSGRNDNEQ